MCYKRVMHCMKKKIYYTLGAIILTIILLTILLSKNGYVLKDGKSRVNNFGVISLMLETAANSGEYEVSDLSNWPTSGYVYNAEKSGCENGGVLIFNESSNKVTIKNNKSDKCYVYFDKEILTLVNYIKGLYTTQGANNLYYHDGTITATVANTTTGIKVGDVIDANDESYRYGGSRGTTNNWVCFGQDDETGIYSEGWCEDEYLYQIIGVFNEQNVENKEIEQRVKLIKAYEATEKSLGLAPNGSAQIYTSSYLGKLDTSPAYYWSGSYSNRSNLWRESTFNSDTLNGTYLTILGSNWSEKIATTRWIVGGNTIAKVSKVAATNIYSNEVINPVSDDSNNIYYISKIGLIYVSDYGFAAKMDRWSSQLYSGSSGTNNWMKLGVAFWTITRRTHDDYEYSAFAINNNGNAVDSNTSSNATVVRPSFYLKSSVTFSGGSGTEGDPYRIS